MIQAQGIGYRRGALTARFLEVSPTVQVMNPTCQTR
jgi:hypothetical protein